MMGHANGARGAPGPAERGPGEGGSRTPEVGAREASGLMDRAQGRGDGARGFSRASEALARRRVALGFVCGAATLVLARPTLRSIALGMSIAAIGEALRIWAAGHLNKSREVTTSGPYRWVAHPLYVGSTIMGVGLAVACANAIVALVIATYLAITLTAAVRSEEAFLRRTFGDRYDRYRSGESDGKKRFGLGQAMANREYRAVIGLTAVALVLVWKATYNGLFWRPGGP